MLVSVIIMNISVNTKKMAVIGDPIGHSMSPFMHNSIIKANGFDAVYFPFLVKEGEVEDFCKAAKTMGFSGFNATMPHKQVLLDLVDEVDPEAKEYASINTVKITEEGRLIGYNTDVRGLLMAFEDRGVKLSGAKIMIVGAGGVAGALVKGCGKMGVESVTVVNRTYEKAAALCHGLSYGKAVEWTPANMSSVAAEADVIVNCTSLGMHGTGSDFADLSFLDDTKALLCDLIYNPWETKFLAYGRQRGLETMNGMSMLIYQGLLAFEKFMDVKLDCRKEHERLIPLCAERLNR